MSRHLVLVTLTLEDARRRAELEPVARELGAHVASLQGEGDPLVGVLDRLAAMPERSDGPDGPDGPSVTDTTIRLVAVTATRSTTGRSWVGRVAGHWVRTRRSPVPVEVSERLARDFGPGEVRAAVETSARRITGSEAPLESPAWAEPPPYRHHVLVCRGPRCSAKGAEQVAAALDTELSRRGLLDTHALVAQTGCLYPCNLAPTVVVHPEGTWLACVSPQEVPAIVEAHLAPDPPALRCVESEGMDGTTR